ncbi:MAG: hypothetical protein LBK04_05160 [Clostridiales Family XIII bacterium]|jgi:hypothetical protein|nr:hypothetical protein [Clostridiales Family XIII bacterium]
MTKKKMKNIAAALIAASLVLALSACNFSAPRSSGTSDEDPGEESYQEIVSSESGAVFTFPEDWKTSDGNDVASINVEAPANDVAFLLVEEPTSDFVADTTDVYYGDLVSENFSSTLDPTTMELSEWEQVYAGKANLPAVRREIKGTIDKKKATMIITIVRTEAYFYQMVQASGASDLSYALPVFDDILKTADFK